MENFIAFYVLTNLVLLIPISYAADKRTVSTGWAALISFLFTPVIGFLFILCYPTKEEDKFQERILVRLEQIIEKLSKEEEEEKKEN